MDEAGDSHTSTQVTEREKDGGPDEVVGRKIEKETESDKVKEKEAEARARSRKRKAVASLSMRSTRRNTKLPGWSKGLNSENPLQN